MQAAASLAADRTISTERASLGGHIERHWASDLVTIAVERHATGADTPAHTHAQAFVTVLLRGTYEETIADHVVPYRPLSAVFHPEGVRHVETIGFTGADLLTVSLAPALLGGLRRKRGGIGSARDLTGGALVWTLLSLYADLPYAARSPLAIEEPVAEVLDTIDNGRPRRPLHEPPWLMRVAQMIRERFRAPVSLSELASAAKVHPVHLSRVYRRVYGRSIRDTVHRMRVVDACRLLESGWGSTADIATAVGFHDETHLSMACRRMNAPTPIGLRRLLAESRAHRLQPARRPVD